MSGGVEKLAELSSLSIDPTLVGNNSDPGARIVMQKRVNNHFLFTFATDVTFTQRETPFRSSISSISVGPLA